jgi:hypothetical protein
LSRFGALTVDDRGGWAGFTALALARGDVERVVDALQRSVPIPQHEVRMRRALRRQVLGQRLPLATRREHVEDCVENLANIHLAPTAAALGWRDHRLNQRPFGIRQVTRISQTTPLSSAAMFRFPHLGTPQSTIRMPHNESQMIHPNQQLSGSALRTAISVSSPRNRVQHLNGRSTTNARLERNQEARHALTLSVAGVTAVMVVCNVTMLLLC